MYFAAYIKASTHAYIAEQVSILIIKSIFPVQVSEKNHSQQLCIEKKHQYMHYCITHILEFKKRVL